MYALHTNPCLVRKHFNVSNRKKVCVKSTNKNMVCLDGNEATARIAYSLSDVSFIYPITPATPMGELSDAWASAGKKNIYGNVMQVTEMDSEASVAGALHGALAGGSLATTFTCSQGLLLMIPNMYKIAGELIPCVIHVSARALAGQALSIFGDHQDVMAVRQTGWALLSSHTVQEAHDMALVAHYSTLQSSIPFLHFFDGFRTSHEINKISVINDDDIKRLFTECPETMNSIRKHHEKALNPAHPHQRGTSQGPDIYFQMLESVNPFYENIPDIVENAMNKVGEITGRKYKLFDYVGCENPEKLIVIMGSGATVAEEAVDSLVKQGHKVGVLKVHLFRPWSAKHFINAIPSSVSKIAVLDRTKESGSQGEPLYLDVLASVASLGLDIKVVGGRYGLGSKNFSPAMIKAVFDNLDSDNIVNGFTVGIMDDVSKKSLPIPDYVNEKQMYECMFWGMGSDGTVGANKDAVKIVSENTDKFSQAYFSYDAHKSGGVTISHIRFADEEIQAPYLIEKADYLAIHNSSYVLKYNFIDYLKPGGILVINTNWNAEQFNKWMPADTKKKIAELKPSIYLIDAKTCADKIGLGKHINMIMQTVFFYLSNIMPFEQSTKLLKDKIAKTYGKKGEKVVQLNQRAVDESLQYLGKFEIPEEWNKDFTYDGNVIHPSLIQEAVNNSSNSLFVQDVVKPMLKLEGDKLPVSVFKPGGFMPPGTTKIEKRAIANQVPVWNGDVCSQCNICAFVCPHAAIRPILVSEEDLQDAPTDFVTHNAKGVKKEDLKYRVQVSPLDCTGCELCVHACPDKALSPVPIKDVLSVEDANWNFFEKLPKREDVFARDSVKGSQFYPPLMEFSGACEGCGETPYVKLLTQEFGERMFIANATGCSSIWGGSAPSNPYTTNKEGRGPAWANSLFEDNAAFGFGIFMATKQRRETLVREIQDFLKTNRVDDISVKSKNLLEKWTNVYNNNNVDVDVTPVAKKLENVVEKEPALSYFKQYKDLFMKPSCWIIGGDGWAYDIGFGPLDHVLSTGENVNILVLDTEMYSNTGGQKSKATPLGAVTKFAANGKRRNKKDLGLIAMQYRDVYVASVCLEANFTQVVKAFKEAESYNGVSIIVAYAPCQLQGICEGMSCSIEESKLAVDSGYWPLYRFDPRKGDKAFQLDSKRIKEDLMNFLGHENRFNILKRSDPETADQLQHDLESFLAYKRNKFMS